MKLQSFQFEETLYESPRTIVHRCRHTSSNQTYILKMLNSNHPSSDDILSLQNEYQLLEQLQELTQGAPEIIKPHGFINDDSACAIVLEDTLSTSLKQTDHANISVQDYIGIFMHIAKSLDIIHKNGYIHRDINPSNILCNEDNNRICLIDFGLSAKGPIDSDGSTLEGTLKYIAPEQSGRMNTSTDHRSDIYSLGATMYTLVTGQVLFPNIDDPMDLIYHHLTFIPESPKSIVDTLPQSLSDIIMRCLAKNKEERYQSCASLISDLEASLEIALSDDPDNVFPLGENDIVFRIPDKIYGRNSELNQLVNALTKQSILAPSLTLVSGPSGSGKSFLIESARSQFDGFYVKGKCEQYKANIPYFALQVSVRHFIHKIISKGETEIKTWKERLNAALGMNIAVLKQLVPEVELLMGKIDDVPELSPLESRERLHMMASDLIRCIARNVRNFVIIIDDIQWIDSSSIELLEYFVSHNRNTPVSILCAHRSENYVDMHHIFKLETAFKNNGCAVEKIQLHPFTHNHVHELIDDVFKGQLKEPDTLIENLIDVSSGNPLFTVKLLEYYHSTGVLIPVSGWNKWRFDPDQFMLGSDDTDIAHFLTAYIQRLPETVQSTLQIAAFIGSEFTIEHVEIVSKQSKSAVHEHLALAEKHSLIVKDHYDKNKLRFIHDQIQNTAASLEIEDSNELHYRIGYTFYTELSDEQVHAMVFDIANHLNASKGLSKKNQTLDLLREFNYRAGLTSLRTSAFELSFHYMKHVMTLAPGLEHYSTGSQAAMLCGEYDIMDKWIETARKITDDPLALSSVGLTEISSFMARNQHKTAIERSVELLHTLNFKLPSKASKAIILSELLKTQIVLPRKKFDKLANMPPMDDERILTIMNILSMVSSASYLADPELFLVIALKQVQLSVRYGTSPMTGIALSLYSLILCGILGKYTDGYKIGMIANELAEASQAGSVIARVKGHLSLFTLHWKESLHAGRHMFYKSYKTAQENGDTEYAAWGIFGYAEYGYFSGMHLHDVLMQFDSAIDIMEKSNQEKQLAFARIFRSGIDFLTGSDKSFESIESDDPSVRFYQSFHQMIHAYLLGDLQDAYTHSMNAFTDIDAVVSTMCNPISYFYDALILIESQTLNTTERRRLKNRMKSLKSWADHSPASSGPLYKIVLAAYKGLNQKRPNQMGLFEAAIEASKAIDALHYEAISHELAAKYAALQGMSFMSKQHMSQSYYLYTKWGASRKTSQMKRVYGNLLALQSAQSTPDNGSKYSYSETQSIDFTSVIKTTLALSQQMELNGLFNKFNELIIKNAGATNGALFIECDEKLCLRSRWSVVEDANVNSETLHTILDIESYKQNEPDRLPYDLIEYCWRAQKVIIFNRHAQSTAFSDDPYLADHPTDSIMAIPIVLKGSSIGVLYLENTITKEVFSSERLSAIQVIVGQLAISYENARLYEEMENKVKERTEELNTLSSEYYQLSIHDQLTKLYNRRKLDEVLQYEADRLGRTTEPLSLIILDIDQFKQINDKFGHQAGDRVLVNISSTLKSSIRSTDTIGRWGGEEFLIICPNTPLDDAMSLAEKLRTLIQDTDMGIEARVTSSFGVASASKKLAFEILLNRADNALYDAKEQGRNRVVASHIPLR